MSLSISCSTVEMRVLPYCDASIVAIHSSSFAYRAIELVHNKCANIQQWISSQKLNIVGLVETWHVDMSSPDLISCAPPGYKYVEKARARKDELSMSTNHGGVCLLYDATLHARRVQLPDSVVRSSLFDYTSGRFQRHRRRPLQAWHRTAHGEACQGTSFSSLVRQRMSPDEAKNTSARTEISTNSH